QFHNLWHLSGYPCDEIYNSRSGRRGTLRQSYGYQQFLVNQKAPRGDMYRARSNSSTYRTLDGGLDKGIVGYSKYLAHYAVYRAALYGLLPSTYLQLVI